MRGAKVECKVRDQLIRQHADALVEAKRLGVQETERSKRALQDVQAHLDFGHDGNRCPGN